MSAPRRGEIWVVDFGEPVGRGQSGYRTAVVVSADPLNESRAGVVVVVPCTTARRGLPSHIELDPSSAGLDEISYAKCEDVKSVSIERFITRVGSAPLDAMSEIARVLRFLLEL